MLEHRISDERTDNLTTISDEEKILKEKHSDEQGHERLLTVPVATRLYKIRWIILATFCAYSFSSSFQWIHLNIIGNIVIRFFNESLPEHPSNKQIAIDWLSVIYMVTYIPLIIPATYILNRKGLRFCAIVGSFMTAVGSWIVASAVSPDSFGLLFFGQTIVASAQIFILEIPSHLAATWFGENEVSTATAIGVFGNQLGIAAAFVLPPEIVKNDDDLRVVALQLRYLLYGTAIFCTISFFSVLIFFREKPLLPPSLSTGAKSGQQKALKTFVEFRRSFFRLLKNSNFILLMITYGINTGSFYAISTLLNPIILHYFPGAEEHAGRIGLTMVLAGVVGSIMAGIWLDRTRTYKITTVTFYVFAAVGMLAFTLCLHCLPFIWIMYAISGFLGFFTAGYLPVGYEFAAEMTYPEHEGMSSGLLNVSAQVFGIVMTFGLSKFVTLVSVLVGNVAITSALFIGAAVTLIIKSDLRRQKVNKELAAIAAANLDAGLGPETCSAESPAVENKTNGGLKDVNTN